MPMHTPIALRPYQVEAADAVFKSIGEGVTRPAVVLPTGTGKTTVMAEVAARFVRESGKRVVALAHTTEIVDQIAERIDRHMGRGNAGVVQAGRNGVGANVVAAMVQTARSESRLAQLTDVGMVIVDECHHAAANSYQTIMGGLGCFGSVPAVGFTATLSRGDDRNLADTWQAVAYTKSIKWAIREGYLCPVRGKAVVLDDLDLSGVKTRAGDYNDAELGEVIGAQAEAIAEAWKTHASDRKTMVFVPNVESAHEVAEALEAKGAKAVVVIGTTPRAERERTYKLFRRGEYDTLVSVSVLTEGFDMPSVDCVLMARPTKLAHVYVQAAGRGLRPADGKTDCLILDVVGVSRMHALVTLASLDPEASYTKTKANGDDLDPEVEEQMEDEERGARLRGVEELVDVDLFAMSDRLWLRTHKGVRFVPAGNDAVFLWPNGDDDFYVGIITVRGARSGGFMAEGGGLVPMANAHTFTLEVARDLAESLALDHGATLANKAASWRTKTAKPSEAQVRFAKGLGIKDADLFTKPRLSDEISIALTSRRLDL